MKNLILIFCLSVVSLSWSQQESQFLNIVNNPFIVNPAAGGLTDVIHLEATSRMQWLGYNGGPRTMLLTGHSQINIGSSNRVLAPFNTDDKPLFNNPTRTTGKLKHIIGGKALNDAIGPFAKSSIHGTYGLHLPFTGTFNAGIGLGIGWSNFRINENRVLLHDEGDDLYATILGNSSSQNFVDANAGLVFYNESFFGGISMAQVLKNKARFSESETNSYYVRHYFLIAKYKTDVGSILQIEPSAVVKLTGKSPASIDVGMRLYYENSAWIGLQYRTSNAFGIQLGANLIKNIYVNYAFEFANGRINTSRNGTHEIQLGFYLGKNRDTKKEIKESLESEK